MGKKGEIITYYSYKGGTGRSMALANTACQLSNNCTDKNYNILMIDWDLEAPGLHRFFRNHVENTKALTDKPGLIDLFIEIDKAIGEKVFPAETETIALLKEIKINKYIQKTVLSNLSLLKAGKFDKYYSTRVNTFNWENLFNRAPFLMKCFASIIAEKYRYILIDSRTGITDTTGICSILLPSKLVIVFTPNFQSLTGVFDLIKQAAHYRRHSNDLRTLNIFPLPSRIDISEETLRHIWRYGGDIEGERIMGYQRQFENLFEDVYDLEKCDLENYFNEVQIQHVSFYSYGEKICSFAEKGDERLSLVRSYRNFTDKLTKQTAPWEEEEQIDTECFENSEQYDVFLIYNSADLKEVSEILLLLSNNNLKVWYSDPATEDKDKVALSKKMMRNARCIIVCIGTKGLNKVHEKNINLQVGKYFKRAQNAIILLVLLPGARNIISHIQSENRINSIRFNSSINELDPRQKLVWNVKAALREIKPHKAINSMNPGLNQ
jgi:cellulose biosynthesis protein BcsQ